MNEGDQSFWCFRRANIDFLEKNGFGESNWDEGLRYIFYNGDWEHKRDTFYGGYE